MKPPALLCSIVAGALLLAALPGSPLGALALRGRCPAEVLATPRVRFSVEQVAAESERGLLRVRNTTPYILSIYVTKVRAGWIRPYATATFRGLRDGYHRVYAVSEYGSAAWGPRDVKVPGNLNIALQGKAAENVAITTASRVFNANKASLLACDKLAERRGENVSDARVEFDVEVDAKGKGKVTARAEGASASLLSCYRMMVTQWKYPATGESYSLSFSHVH